MFSRKVSAFFVGILLVAFLFTACLGGGASPNPSSSPTPQTQEQLCKPRQAKDIDFGVLNSVVATIQRESVFRDIASDPELLLRGSVERVFAFLTTPVPLWTNEMVEKELERSRSFQTTPDFSVLNEIIKRLSQDPQFQDLNDSDQKESLLKAAVDGIIKTLEDPFAAYVTAEEYQIGALNFSGKYKGLGISLIRNFKGEITLDRVEKGSAAEKAGLVTGDAILEVDGKSTSSCTVNQFIIEIKTRQNPELNIKIRTSSGEEKTIKVMMEEIKQRQVTSCPGVDLPHGRGSSTQDLIYTCPLKDRDGNPVTDIAYIQIKQFSGQAVEDFTEVLRSIDQKSLGGLVIDIRDNPGGGLHEVTLAVDYFLENADVIYIEKSEFKNNEPTGATTVARSDEIDLVDPKLTVVILVNKNSYSGAELFPAALRDNGRATIISSDDRTGGKGTINHVFELKGGKQGALYIATAIYLTPNGNMVERFDFDKDGYYEIGGIAPDIKVNWTSDDFIENGRNPNYDPTLFEAVEYIRKHLR